MFCEVLFAPSIGIGPGARYLLVAGLVFVPLTEPFLTEKYGEDWENCPARLTYLWERPWRSFPEEQASPAVAQTTEFLHSAREVTRLL